jgi:hypothetical protein
VKTLLKRHDAYYHMPVQNGMGSPTLDFVGCHAGRFFAVETKAGNKLMTPRQVLTAKQMDSAGAAVFLVSEVQGMNELEDWLERGTNDGK